MKSTKRNQFVDMTTRDVVEAIEDCFLAAADAAGFIMEEVASRSVRAKSILVEGPTFVGFVLWVPLNGPQLALSVSVLAFVSVLAILSRCEMPAQFSFVPLPVSHSFQDGRGEVRRFGGPWRVGGGGCV